MPKDMTCARMRKYIELRDKLWHWWPLKTAVVDTTEAYLHETCQGLFSLCRQTV